MGYEKRPRGAPPGLLVPLLGTSAIDLESVFRASRGRIALRVSRSLSARGDVHDRHAHLTKAATALNGQACLRPYSKLLEGISQVRQLVNLRPVYGHEYVAENAAR